MNGCSLQNFLIKLIFMYSLLCEHAYAKDGVKIDMIFSFPDKQLVYFPPNYDAGERIFKYEDRYLVVKLPQISLTIEQMFSDIITNQLNYLETYYIVFIGADEFRSYRHNEPQKYALLVEAIKNSSKLFEQKKITSYFVQIENEDQGLAIYKKAIELKIISNDDSFIYIERYFISVAFYFRDDQSNLLSSYVSKYAKRIGENNIFTMHYDCSGPEYMEILTNNHIIRTTINKDNLTNPCYPYRYTHEYGDKMFNYETCDPTFYKNNSEEAKFYIKGRYNQDDCEKLLGNFISSKERCNGPDNCIMFDPTSKIFEALTGKIKVSILNSGKIGVDWNQFLDSPVFAQQIIKEYCIDPGNSWPTVSTDYGETCFHATYLLYLWKKLKNKNRDFIIVDHINILWSSFFKPPFVYPEPPPTTRPTTTTTTITPTTVSKKEETKSINLGLIIGIIIGILLLLLILALLLYFCCYKNATSDKYDVSHARN